MSLYLGGLVTSKSIGRGFINPVSTLMGTCLSNGKLIWKKYIMSHSIHGTGIFTYIYHLN